MNEVVLVTGANGEVGHSLIPELSLRGAQIIGLDIADIDEDLKKSTASFVKANILDKKILEKIFSEYRINTVYHLGALLSTVAEKDPDRAQSVNVEGTANLLSVANLACIKNNFPTKFIFPSTIAVYGLPDIKTKNETGAVAEEEYEKPVTIYGISKLYCENLGIYYSQNYKMLETGVKRLLDFRSVRLSGLISALTVPTGGTSDYGAEMIHTAAQGKDYEAFVREDTVLPFMVMADAVKALIGLAQADSKKLTRRVYNVTSFSITAKEIADIVLKVFPDTAIDYNPHAGRQRIVDSWPAAVDDSKARADWAWKPDYDINKAFNEYLIPEISNKYRK